MGGYFAVVAHTLHKKAFFGKSCFFIFLAALPPLWLTIAARRMYPKHAVRVPIVHDVAKEFALGPSFRLHPRPDACC